MESHMVQMVIITQVEWHPFHKHYSCGCKGYSFRKTCRHIKELSEEFRKNLFNKGVKNEKEIQWFLVQ